jgi:3-oxoadipate enol-lactonase
MPFAELNETRLHYELSGASSAPALVLAHSLGANLHMWDKIVPALERQYRVVRYDTRGHGESAIPSAAFTIAELARDAVQLLDRLQIDQAHFCGLSLGGVVGMKLGIHHADRIARLVLANTAARIGTREGWDERIAEVRSGGLGPIAESAMGRWFTARYIEANPGEIEAIRNMIANTSVDGYLACSAALRDADLRPEVPTIKLRTLIITGSEDPATPPADGRWLEQSIAGSTYLELPSAHLSAWERSEEFQRAVLDFLG